MPATTTNSCFDPAYIIYKVDGINVYDDCESFHFEECRDPNIWTSSLWKYFWSNFRCHCPCHSLHLAPKDSERLKNIRTVKLLFGCLTGGAVPVYLILYFA